jgi:acylphosphatase
MQCIEFNIKGNVQGVGFRWSTKSKADELKLSGYVKNLSDGTVELLACGNGWQLDQLKEWLENGGPHFADITELTSKEVQPKDLPISFEIAH